MKLTDGWICFPIHQMDFVSMFQFYLLQFNHQWSVWRIHHSWMVDWLLNSISYWNKHNLHICWLSVTCWVNCRSCWCHETKLFPLRLSQWSHENQKLICSQPNSGHTLERRRTVHWNNVSFSMNYMLINILILANVIVLSDSIGEIYCFAQWGQE